jgi:hypothetical protein
VRALVLALALAAAGASQDAFQAGEAARQAGRYAEALRHAADVEDASARARLELNTRYHAGDLGGALRAGRRGLAEAPEDPWLLYYTALLALEVGALDTAADCVPRLAAAAAAPELEADTALFYRRQAAGFAEQLADELRAQALRDAGTRRARVTVLLGGALAALAFTWLMRQRPHRLRAEPHARRALGDRYAQDT